MAGSPVALITSRMLARANGGSTMAPNDPRRRLINGIASGGTALGQTGAGV